VPAQLFGHHFDNGEDPAGDRPLPAPTGNIINASPCPAPTKRPVGRRTNDDVGARATGPPHEQGGVQEHTPSAGRPHSTTHGCEDYKLVSLATEQRHEVIILAVVQRKTAVSRTDNVFLSWMRIVTKMLRLDGSQRRRAWQAWPQCDTSIPKLHEDALRPIQLYLDARPASSKSVAESSHSLVAAAKANGAVLLATSASDLPALPE
jgi:hypothetical protein